jgi:hypothetical protein
MSIEGDHPFNFIIGKTVGDEQIATLNQMITGIPELAVPLTAFRDTVLFLAN